MFRQVDFHKLTSIYLLNFLYLYPQNIRSYILYIHAIFIFVLSFLRNQHGLCAEGLEHKEARYGVSLSAFALVVVTRSDGRYLLVQV